MCCFQQNPTGGLRQCKAVCFDHRTREKATASGGLELPLSNKERVYRRLGFSVNKYYSQRETET